MLNKIYENYRPLMEEWKEQIDIVKEHIEGFSDVESTQLAIMLENTKTELSYARGRVDEGIVNEVTDISMINTMASNVFDIITAVMPNLIANDIVSVQPLDRRTGQIFFLKFKYGTDKGSIERGTNMLTPTTGFAAQDYSSEKVNDEVVGEGGAAQKIETTFAQVPVKPGTVVITDGDKEAVDNGAGAFTGDLVGSGSNEINYDTGELSLNIASTISSADITASWEYDLNSPNAQVMDVNVTVESVPVVARPRKLKSVYMFDTAYDLKMAFGLDMDTVILKATSGEIGFEIDNEIMQDLLAIARSDFTWNIYPPYRGMDVRTHRQTIVDAINEASNAILAKTKRYEGVFVVCGVDFATVIEGIGKDNFKRMSPGGIVGGPHFVGVLEEKYRVYKNPYYPKDAMLIGAKGEMFIEAGYVYAPYLPVFATQLLVDENIKARRGFCTVYAKKVINPFMYSRLTMTYEDPEALIEIEA